MDAGGVMNDDRCFSSSRETDAAMVELQQRAIIKRRR